MQKTYRNWQWLLGGPTVVALICLGAALRAARAEDSIAGWPAKEFAHQKPAQPNHLNFREALRRGTFNDATEEQQFSDYYNKTLFPNVTNEDNRQSANDVAIKVQHDLRQCERERVQNPDVFNKLTDLTLTYMTAVAGEPQYHPAVRVNAILVIGEVDSPKAAKVLLDTATGKETAFFALRVAAMDGLVRLAAVPGNKSVLFDADLEPKVLKGMVHIVGFHVANNRRADGFNWMRGQAADVLGDLGSPGSENEVPPALRDMLEDKELAIQLRSKAARALGKLKYNGNLPAAGPYESALAEFAGDALSSDQPADRARVRLVAHDVEDARKRFASPPLSALSSNLKKTLDALNKDTEDPMTIDDLKKAIVKAKESLK